MVERISASPVPTLQCLSAFISHPDLISYRGEELSLPLCHHAITRRFGEQKSVVTVASVCKLSARPPDSSLADKCQTCFPMPRTNYLEMDVGHCPARRRWLRSHFRAIPNQAAFGRLIGPDDDKMLHRESKALVRCRQLGEASQRVCFIRKSLIVTTSSRHRQDVASLMSGYRMLSNTLPTLQLSQAFDS